MKRGKKQLGIDMSLTDTDAVAFLKTLKRNGTVNVGGLGLFEVVKMKPRTMYHNTARRELTTKTYCKIRFTPTGIIKTVVNEE
jgi:nucleoid DNA-binding protein